MNVGIYVYDDVEVLDFAGPYEVFTTAARVQSRDSNGLGAPLFSVMLVGQRLGRVRARAGLQVDVDFSIFKHPALDLLVVAGGVVDNEIAKLDVLEWISRQARRVKVLSSVCTGAFLLAEAGCLQGLEATTHWEDVAALRERFPGLRVQQSRRWIDQGNVITSAGISAGIDMSLHLVRRLHSAQLAHRTARQMDFDWRQDP